MACSVRFGSRSAILFHWAEFEHRARDDVILGARPALPLLAALAHTWRLTGLVPSQTSSADRDAPTDCARRRPSGQQFRGDDTPAEPETRCDAPVSTPTIFR